ncbi:Presequence protease 1, chloroplastic/mitochondrial [Chlamydiales bacterium STE3]|nr:Presequence protease 1, chloroplastic/mitochondrial [Chlamydiales bacterium STE3]
MNPSPFNQIGYDYQGFKIVKVLPIPELQCVLREIIHEKSGASVMHIETDDTENLFCLSFQTLPDSSNGVAHILEHTVLCGSQKFPVKDPFFAMSRRSLNTFMNALTGSDFTCYPAASQIEKDFYNLLDVYLDAVFHPKLHELSFRQEGHRLEFEVFDDPTTPLVHRGIVFNEMKGVMNSATSRLQELLSEKLFPHLTYGCNSGGDPKIIPYLSYEELIAFHKKFYNPSRCLFFFYGNLPTQKHLDFILEKALKAVEKAPPLPILPLQPRYKEPVKITSSYPLAPHEDTEEKTYVAFGWLTCLLIEQDICLALGILEIILMDTDASLLKKKLMQSGLCKQAHSSTDNEISEVPFSIILRGCKAEDADQIEQLIFDSLNEIVETGIPLDLIENAIHQVEFYRSEITGDHSPFGLSLFFRSALFKQHGGKPEYGLMIHSLFEELRNRVNCDPQFFVKLIQKYFLNNPHFVRIVFNPDKHLEEEEVKEEKQILQEMCQRFTKEEKERLVNEAKRLKIFQKEQEEEELDVLPKIDIEDIPRKARGFQLDHQVIDQLNIYHHNCFTNEIVYADMTFVLPALQEEELFYIRLLSVLLPQIGVGERDFEENLNYIQAHTGGVSTYLSLNLQAEDHTKFFPSFHIRGKALHRKVENLFLLIKDMAEKANFNDLERIKTILVKQMSALESSINSQALKYAINLSSSGLNLASKIADEWYGLPYYWKLKELVDHFDQKKELLLEKLLYLKDLLLCGGKHDLIISSDDKIFSSLFSRNFYGLANLKTISCCPWKCDYPLQKVSSQGRVIASQVAFTGKVFPTVSYVHPDSPALNIASYLFDNLVLHRRIREEGGAYGGGSVCNSLSGNFYFYSYRDPNISKTLEAFEVAVNTILQGEFDEEDLEEAKFEMIQSLDSPIAPGSRAIVAYSWLQEGKTQQIRQNFRDAILAMTKEKVIDAVKRQIVPHMNQSTDVVFAGKDLLEKENQALATMGKIPLEILSLDAPI